MRVNIISLVALAATAAGLTVTSPRMGERIDPDMPLTIKWQSVSTDPDTFTIELVNQNVYPPTTTIVAEDIDSSKGSYTVNAKTFTGVDDGKGYQINFLSPTSGILAQSQQFRVTEPGEIASASASSSVSSTPTLATSSSVSAISSPSTSSFITETSSSIISTSATPMTSSSITASSISPTTSTHLPTSTFTSNTISSTMSPSTHISTTPELTSASMTSSTSLSTATHLSTTSTTTRKSTSTTTSSATESASTTTNAAAVLMPPAGSVLLGLLALVL